MNIEINKNFSIKNFLLKFILNFLQVLLYSFTYVIYKYFMKATYMSSFEILFFQGLIDILLSFILIAILIKCEAIYNFQYYWEQIRERVVYFVIVIFLNFGCFSQILIIIDIFSPIYIFLVVLIFYAFAILYVTVVSELSEYFYLFLIAMIFLCLSVFFILVFIEFIELNFCGLSHMTKKNIGLRANLDSVSNIDNDTNRKDSNEIIYDDDYIINFGNNKSNDGRRDTFSSVEEMNNIND